MALKETIDLSANKRHDLFTWVCTQYEDVNDITSEGASDEETVKKNNEIMTDIYNELNKYIRYMTVIEKVEELDSHYIAIRLSQLYSSLLLQLQKESPGKVFDLAELLTNILAEEDVSLDEFFEENDEKQKNKRKKTAAKKHYTFTPAKDIACTTLTQLFELFGLNLSALAPLLLSVIFKNLKKIMEKEKYNHATFMVSLMKLLSSIVRNGNSSIFDHTYVSKFTKLSKTVFEKLYKNEEAFPVDFISVIIEIWPIIYRQDEFIKEHQDNLISTFYSRFCEGEIGIYGFANDSTRIYTARSLAEILFCYQYTKNLISVEDVLGLYVKLFSGARTRDIKSGCFESLSHYLILNYSADSTFLSDCKYLTILKSLSEIVSAKNTNGLKMGTISRYLRYFEYLHNSILVYIPESSKIQMLLQLVTTDKSPEDLINMGGFGLNLDVLKEKQNGRTEWFILLQLEFLQKLLIELSSSFSGNETAVQQLKSKLLELCTSDYFSVRIYSNKVLKTYLKNCPGQISEIMESSLNILTSGFEEKEKLIYSRLHGHAFLIANLIENADNEYVSYELIMRITVFATSFVKNNTTSTSSELYFKSLICWILLIGLMNYHDEQYLKMQTPQLFLFWKVLLTHTYSYRNEDELMRNLEIRTHALTCLLAFLKNSLIDRDMAKQVSYLLTKCSNFNHSVDLKSEVIDKALLSNENKILQVYLKIQQYMRTDFNSALLILIVKNFSNPNLYNDSKHSSLNVVRKLKNKSSGKEDDSKELKNEITVNNLLRQQDGFAFGLSSSIISYTFETTEFATKDDIHLSDCWPVNQLVWYKPFEHEVLKPISPVLLNDSLVLLYEPRSDIDQALSPPKVTTSLVDSSMKLFSSVFPYLNSKIQYSVLENLNLSLFSKATTGFRSVAIAANICNAIYRSLKTMNTKDIPLEMTVGQLLLESLKKIDFANDSYLTTLKAECIGLLLSQVRIGLHEEQETTFVTSQIDTIIKNIVDIEEPYPRMFFVLSLASAFKYNNKFVSFDKIFEIILTLANDPHPIVHSWALRAIYTLIEKQSMNNSQVSTRLITSMENFLINPMFGQYNSSPIKYNYNQEFSSYVLIPHILSLLTEKIGPNFVDLQSEVKDAFRNISMGSLLSESAACEMQGLNIYENIATFKMEGILNDLLFIKAAEGIISQSILQGIGSSYFNSRFTRCRGLILHTTSLSIVSKCFKLFSQLLKLGKGNLFNEELEMQGWRYLALYPSELALHDYFFELLMKTYSNKRWFPKLFQIFAVSTEKLFSSLFKSFDDFYTQTGTKSKENSDSEAWNNEEHVAEEDNAISQDANEKHDELPWRSKRLVIQMLIKLSEEYSFNSTMFITLKDNLPNIIRIAFQASTSSIEEVNILGLDLLNLILTRFINTDNSKEDSILEQQEAQITSALMPAFHKGSSPTVISRAINVSGDILVSKLVPSVQSSRIGRLLIKLLDIFGENGTQTVVGEARLVTKQAKRKVELAILNSWANIIQYSILKRDNDILEFSRDYWSVLLPLWIISLREYLMIKYEAPDPKSTLTGSEMESFEVATSKLKQYELQWLNFAKALAGIIDFENDAMFQCLEKEEIESFMFILATRCLEDISKCNDDDKRRMELLVALHAILKTNVLLTCLLEDNIFPEIISILDRLILVGTYEEKLMLVEIINDIIIGYTKQKSTHNLFLMDIDKLYELLRLLMSVISDIAPYVRYDYVGGNSEKVPNNNEIALFRRVITVIESNINGFDDIFKVDLYACLLFMIGKIYQSNAPNYLVPTTFQLLKSITKELVGDKNYSSLLDVFFLSIKKSLSDSLNTENNLITYLLLLNNGFIGINQDDTSTFADLIIRSIMDDGLKTIAFQGLKRFVEDTPESTTKKLIIKKILLGVVKILDIEILETDSLKLFLDIFSIVVKKYFEDSKNKTLLYTLFLTLILKLNRIDKGLTNVLGSELRNIVKRDPESVKKVISTKMNELQRAQIESIVSENIKSTNNSSDNDVNLKSFD